MSDSEFLDFCFSADGFDYADDDGLGAFYERTVPAEFEQVSLEDAGLEECTEHAHGYHESVSGSVYDYTDYFYDGDESAFSPI